jgi:WhiB family redox-sensing transcriptional regulator
VNTSVAIGAADWQSRAACQDANADDFFPVSDPLSDGYARQAARALAVCRRCPVRLPCRDYAVSAQEPWGIWGGMTPGDRSDALQNLTRGAA